MYELMGRHKVHSNGDVNGKVTYKLTIQFLSSDPSATTATDRQRVLTNIGASCSPIQGSIACTLWETADGTVCIEGSNRAQK